MSHAERQAAYRRRQWRATLEASVDPHDQPTPILLQALKLLLEDLDNPDKAALHDSQRGAAEKAVKALCTRYKLKPNRSR